MKKKLFNGLDKLKVIVTALLIAVFNVITVYAYNDGVTQYDNVLNWILGWIGRIGIVIAIWGAVQIGLSFSSEDAGQRRKGILELISGLMVMAVGYGAKTIIGY
jgi:TRAP-type C4-dicarboxylate transport system permease small subunit